MVGDWQKYKDKTHKLSPLIAQHALWLLRQFARDADLSWCTWPYHADIYI